MPHRILRASGLPPVNELDIRWHEYASCLSAPRDLFFPPLEAEKDPEFDVYVADLSATYCIGCPVRIDCLTHALNFPERHGIWAGFSSRERRLIQDADLSAAVALRLKEAREIPPLERDACPAGPRLCRADALQAVRSDRQLRPVRCRNCGGWHAVPRKTA